MARVCLFNGRAQARGSAADTPGMNPTNRINRIRRSLPAVLVVGLSGICLAGPVSPAAAKSCGDIERNGIKNLRTVGVGCSKAEQVAKEFSFRIPGQSDRTHVNGYRCKATSVSREYERVTCKRGDKRIRFRSTKQIEFPPAESNPCVNCGRRS